MNLNELNTQIHPHQDGDVVNIQKLEFMPIKIISMVACSPWPGKVSIPVKV